MAATSVTEEDGYAPSILCYSTPSSAPAPPPPHQRCSSKTCSRTKFARHLDFKHYGKCSLALPRLTFWSRDFALCPLQAKMASDFEQISSWARHARYSDVETAMNQVCTTMRFASYCSNGSQTFTSTGLRYTCVCLLANMRHPP